MRNGTAVVVLGCLLCSAGCAARAPQQGRAAPPVGNFPAIVHVVSRDRTVTISSGPEGLLYSLQDADGRVLMADATATQFEAQHPDMYREIRESVATAVRDE